MPMTKQEMADKYREKRKEYYQKNKERILEERKKQKDKDDPIYKEYIRDQARVYREKNPDKIKASQETYKAKNKREKS